MGDFANRNEIDALAAELFSKDHPERSWDAFDNIQRLGVASATEKAVYRGFATARLAADRRNLQDAAIAAAALASGATGFKPRV